MTDISNNIKHHNKLIDKMVRGVLYAFTIASASFIFYHRRGHYR